VSAWVRSSSSDRRALDVVDGAGAFAWAGPHYSRRSPGSRTFTGCGREVVLVTDCGRAAWAVIYQSTPAKAGSGSTRGRPGLRDAACVERGWVWRNNMFRNLGAGLSSELIRAATEMTYREWVSRYGSLPPERLRTEVDGQKVLSTNPGYCYMMAGWEIGPTKRGKRFLYAPPPPASLPVSATSGVDDLSRIAS
jgi:hypothetical protein